MCRRREHNAQSWRFRLQKTISEREPIQYLAISLMTRHEKIIDLDKNSDWVCQQGFWKGYIFSLHKRRAEIVKKTDKNGNRLYEFFERPREHGIALSKDLLLRFSNLPKNSASIYEKYRYSCYLIPGDSLHYLHGLLSHGHLIMSSAGQQAM